MKDVIYMLTTGFQKMPSFICVLSWRKLWKHIENLVIIMIFRRVNNSILQDIQTLSDNEITQPNVIEIWITHE